MLLSLIRVFLMGAVQVHEPVLLDAPPEAPWRNVFAFYLGQSELDSDFWNPVDRPIAFGMDYALVHRVGLGFELGMNLGFDQEESGTVDFGGLPFETELITALFELSAGARFERHLGGRWSLYAGGGMAWVDVEAETIIEDDLVLADDNDSDFGFYYHGGLKFWIRRQLFVGLDFRSLQGSEVEIDSFETEADYTQFALVLGGGL